MDNIYKTTLTSLEEPAKIVVPIMRTVGEITYNLVSPIGLIPYVPHLHSQYPLQQQYDRCMHTPHLSKQEFHHCCTIGKNYWSHMHMVVPTMDKAQQDEYASKYARYKARFASN
jgi:hypothetical protein